MLSLPPVTNLLTFPLAGPGLLLTREPGVVEGAQETELTPIPCAGKILWSILVSLNSRTETLPSLDAHANRQPDSWGDQEIMFTDAVCRAKSNTLVQAVPCSRQMKTLPS